MNKKVKTIITVAAILAAMAIAYALGASGNASMVKGKQADILVGMLVTTQSLPESDDGRVYAELVDGEYVFKGIDGMQCFFTNKDDAVVSHTDEAFTDKSCGLHVINDDQQNVELKAKLYLGTSFKEILIQNPVYQTESGEVYAISGQGVGYSGGEGIGGSFSLSESTERYEDGKTVSYGTSVDIAVEVIAVPEKITVLQFDAAGNLISSDSFAPGELPDSMESSAAYIVVGTASQSGTKYEVFQPDDGSISALYCRNDGVCIKQSCAVNWEGE